ncbi:MAG: HAD family phosphatase [Clostridia bacterium]|nr:HAD family phosphatase [Clostridia bacterium]
MIKNIVFDMGGVLIDYNPEKTLYGMFDKEIADILLKEVFRNPLWSDKDRGIIMPDEIMEKVRDRIPESVYDKTCEMVDNFYPYMPPFEKMEGFVRMLKEKGFGIYLLSNASHDFHERRKGIPALAMFDGVIVSADHKLLKPEKEIYEKLYDTFGLRPEECFFIDDVAANIEGAAATGMQGHCYHHGNLEILIEDMKERKILD